MASSSEGPRILTRWRSRSLPWGRHARQHARSAFHPIANLHADFRRLRKDHICARAELNHPNALPPDQLFSWLVIEHNAPRQQPGNLLKDYRHAVAFHGHDVLLVIVGRNRSHGVAKLAFLIDRALDHAADR